ncbi:MAG: GAF domain-containing protein [Burkholderiales bacterium]
MTNKNSKPGLIAAQIDIATMRHIIQLAGSDFEVFFYTIAIESAKLVGADGAALLVTDAEGMIGYKFFYGLPELFQKEILNYRAPRDTGTVGHALKEEKAVFTGNYSASPYAVTEFVDYGLKANWIIPFHIGSHITPTAALAIGWFHNYPEREPDESQLEIIKLFCDLINSGLSRQAMIDDWKNQANRDALTGLPNRRALMDYLPLAIERARRSGQWLVVCVMDLDDFKPVNDTYGHAAGDTLLMELAYRLKTVLRTADMVARLGGDEFVLVLENLESMEDMETALNRINEVIVQPVELPNGHIVIVDMSMGITIFPQDDSTPDYLLRHADNALYIIKESKDKRARSWQIWQ